MDEISTQVSSHLCGNLDGVRERIAAAAVRSGRSPDEITLVAVTKTHSPEIIIQALVCGVSHVGENRIGELEAKRLAVDRLLTLGAPVPTWHMVGHVQSRKAARAVEVADVIESVESLKLARRLDMFAAQVGRRIPVLLELNVSGEGSKYGWPASGWDTDPEVAAALKTWIAAVLVYENLQVRGLMTMAPWKADEGMIRSVFRSLRSLLSWLQGEFPSTEWHDLSMGMSDDFEIAIEEGATIVRVGRAIFGPRQTALP
jgi:hypothetical protein